MRRAWLLRLAGQLTQAGEQVGAGGHESTSHRRRGSLGSVGKTLQVACTGGTVRRGNRCVCLPPSKELNGACVNPAALEAGPAACPAGRVRNAAGIYVDGGRNIVVERNTSWRNDVGIEVNAIQPGALSTAVTVRDNFVFANQRVGISLGASDPLAGSVTDSRP